ncbi:MAG: sulfatase-like hydrolase/transferase [Acidobacteria bacterium]|nr:sulfatase-like hydrolase/transferase [Acidobacteriota bacterium]
MLTLTIIGVVFLRPSSFQVHRTPDQNVLLITIDTLRADALGCYGGPAATPNLDGLARDGIRFDFAHAHSVVTLPSHANILTGLYPFQHGIRDNNGFRLRQGTATLASLLKAHGFVTGAFVGAFVLDSRFGLDAGFDAYDDRLPESQGPMELSIAERRAEVVIEHARRWITSQDGGRPWFAWVHLYDPHSPYAPPAPFDVGYTSQPYYGEVAYVDKAVGPLLDMVRATLSRPTLLVVTGDHGEALGEHDELTHGLFAYEPTLQIPLILAQIDPARTRRSTRGVVSSIPARHVDVVPTILDALQIPAPSSLAGRTLLSAGGQDAERTSYFEAMSSFLNRAWAPLQGVMAGREKYIELPIPELYDLAADPREQTNLVDRRAERRRALKARLQAFAAPPVDERQAETAEVSSRLRALGYVTGSSTPKRRYTEEDDPKRLVNIDRLIHLGVQLAGQKRAQEAIQMYEQAITQRPDMSLAYRHLAYLHWESGRPGVAIATLKRALAAGALDTDLRAQLGLYLGEAGAAREALALLEAGGGLTSTDVDAVNALGIAYARAGRPIDALRAFRRVLELDRANAMAFQNIGSAHLIDGDLDAAKGAFQQALATDATLATAHTGLGVVEMRLGRRAEALAAWKRAVELDPREYDALFNLATELLNEGQVEAARPFVERFVRTAPPASYGNDIKKLARALKNGR